MKGNSREAYRFQKNAEALPSDGVRTAHQKAKKGSSQLLAALLRYAADHPNTPYGHHILVSYERMRRV